MGRVKALVFDVFGTVVDWREGIARDAAPFLARHGRPDLDGRAFADAWRKRYQPAMEECRAGRRPFTRLDTLHRENLENVLRDNGMDPARIGEAELDAMNRAWHRLDPWPDSVAGLARLKERYVISTFSNGNVALLTDMAKRAGLPWDLILSAELVRHYKPDPETYLMAPNLLDLRPDEVMLVAAHPSDLRAAQYHGLRAAYVLRPLEWGPEGKAEPADPAFDLVVDDLVELAEKLEA